MGYSSQADKQSPHSSPRMARRSTTPNLMAVENDLYAAHPPTLSLLSSHAHPQPSAPPLHVVNGTANTGGKTSNLSSSSSCVNAVGSSVAKTTNRVSAPATASISTVSVPFSKENNDNCNSSYALLQNQNNSRNNSGAPPLPPRKSSPGLDSTIKPHQHGMSLSAVPPSCASSLLSLNNVSLLSSNQSISTENMSAIVEVPKTSAPPIPLHSKAHKNVDTIADDLRTQQTSSSIPVSMTTTILPAQRSIGDDDIVGPAETISGIIDTRPMGARLPVPLFRLAENIENATEKSNQLATSSVTPSSYTKHVRYNPQAFRSSASNQNLASSSVDLSHLPQDGLLFENVTINSKDYNVPYENINLEYIARLMSEGYSKENAITALGISRNNIEMACDILHEFVSKSSV